MKEMPGFFSPWERLASPLQELIRSREFLTDPKQHTGKPLVKCFLTIPSILLYL
jgi:hypothetical protein